MPINNFDINSSMHTREYFFTRLDGFQEFQKRHSLSYIKKRKLSLLDLRPGLKFLDIGHGRGDMLYYCEKQRIFAYGIDYSDVANSIAKDVLRCPPNAKIMKADCGVLPFKDGFFDRVLIGDLIEHLSFERGFD